MNEKILIADDRTDTVNLLTYALSDMGYVVSSACDGKTALDKMKKDSFDLIILDIMMPGLSGKDILRKIRADKKYNKTKIIILTAVKYTKQEQDEMVNLGTQGFLTKPISMKALGSEIKKVFAKKK